MYIGRDRGIVWIVFFTSFLSNFRNDKVNVLVNADSNTALASSLHISDSLHKNDQSSSSNIVSQVEPSLTVSNQLLETLVSSPIASPSHVENSFSNSYSVINTDLISTQSSKIENSFVAKNLTAASSDVINLLTTDASLLTDILPSISNAMNTNTVTESLNNIFASTDQHNASGTNAVSNSVGEIVSSTGSSIYHMGTVLSKLDTISFEPSVSSADNSEQMLSQQSHPLGFQTSQTLEINVTKSDSIPDSTPVSTEQASIKISTEQNSVKISTEQNSVKISSTIYSDSESEPLETSTKTLYALYESSAVSSLPVISSVSLQPSHVVSFTTKETLMPTFSETDTFMTTNVWIETISSAPEEPTVTKSESYITHYPTVTISYIGMSVGGITTDVMHSMDTDLSLLPEATKEAVELSSVQNTNELSSDSMKTDMQSSFYVARSSVISTYSSSMSLSEKVILSTGSALYSAVPSSLSALINNTTELTSDADKQVTSSKSLLITENSFLTPTQGSSSTPNAFSEITTSFETLSPAGSFFQTDSALTHSGHNDLSYQSSKAPLTTEVHLSNSLTPSEFRDITSLETSSSYGSLFQTDSALTYSGLSDLSDQSSKIPLTTEIHLANSLTPSDFREITSLETSSSYGSLFQTNNTLTYSGHSDLSYQSDTALLTTEIHLPVSELSDSMDYSFTASLDINTNDSIESSSNAFVSSNTSPISPSYITSALDLTSMPLVSSAYSNNLPSMPLTDSLLLTTKTQILTDFSSISTLSSLNISEQLMSSDALHDSYIDYSHTAEIIITSTENLSLLSYLSPINIMSTGIQNESETDINVTVSLSVNSVEMLRSEFDTASTIISNTDMTLDNGSDTIEGTVSSLRSDSMIATDLVSTSVINSSRITFDFPPTISSFSSKDIFNTLHSTLSLVSVMEISHITETDISDSVISTRNSDYDPSSLPVTSVLVQQKSSNSMYFTDTYSSPTVSYTTELPSPLNKVSIIPSLAQSIIPVDILSSSVVSFESLSQSSSSGYTFDDTLLPFISTSLFHESPVAMVSGIVSTREDVLQDVSSSHYSYTTVKSSLSLQSPNSAVSAVTAFSFVSSEKPAKSSSYSTVYSVSEIESLFFSSSVNSKFSVETIYPTASFNGETHLSDIYPFTDKTSVLSFLPYTISTNNLPLSSSYSSLYDGTIHDFESTLSATDSLSVVHTVSPQIISSELNDVLVSHSSGYTESFAIPITHSASIIDSTFPVIYSKSSSKSFILASILSSMIESITTSVSSTYFEGEFSSYRPLVSTNTYDTSSVSYMEKSTSFVKSTSTPSPAVPANTLISDSYFIVTPSINISPTTSMDIHPSLSKSDISVSHGYSVSSELLQSNDGFHQVANISSSVMESSSIFLSASLVDVTNLTSLPFTHSVHSEKTILSNDVFLTSSFSSSGETFVTQSLQDSENQTTQIEILSGAFSSSMQQTGTIMATEVIQTETFLSSVSPSNVTLSSLNPSHVSSELSVNRTVSITEESLIQSSLFQNEISITPSSIHYTNINTPSSELITPGDISITEESLIQSSLFQNEISTTPPLITKSSIHYTNINTSSSELIIPGDISTDSHRLSVEMSPGIISSLDESSITFSGAESTFLLDNLSSVTSSFIADKSLPFESTMLTSSFISTVHPTLVQPTVATVTSPQISFSLHGSLNSEDIFSTESFTSSTEIHSSYFESMLSMSISYFTRYTTDTFLNSLISSSVDSFSILITSSQDLIYSSQTSIVTHMDTPIVISQSHDTFSPLLFSSFYSSLSVLSSDMMMTSSVSDKVSSSTVNISLVNTASDSAAFVSELPSPSTPISINVTNYGETLSYTPTNLNSDFQQNKSDTSTFLSTGMMVPVSSHYTDIQSSNLIEVTSPTIPHITETISAYNKTESVQEIQSVSASDIWVESSLIDITSTINYSETDLYASISMETETYSVTLNLSDLQSDVHSSVLRTSSEVLQTDILTSLSEFPSVETPVYISSDSSISSDYVTPSLFTDRWSTSPVVAFSSDLVNTTVPQTMSSLEKLSNNSSIDKISESTSTVIMFPSEIEVTTEDYSFMMSAFSIDVSSFLSSQPITLTDSSISITIVSSTAENPPSSTNVAESVDATSTPSLVIISSTSQLESTAVLSTTEITSSVISTQTTSLVESTAVPSATETTPESTVLPSSSTSTVPTTTPAATLTASKDYWTVTVIIVKESVNVTSKDFILVMETKLLAMFKLAENLISEGGRRKRYVKDNNIELELTEVRRIPNTDNNVKMSYLIRKDNQYVLAKDVASTMNVLDIQEMAIQLEYVVVTKAKAFNEPDVVPTSSDDNNIPLIIGAVIGSVVGLVVIIWGGFCIYSHCCRNPRKQTREPHLVSVTQPANGKEEDEQKPIVDPADFTQDDESRLIRTEGDKQSYDVTKEVEEPIYSKVKKNGRPLPKPKLRKTNTTEEKETDIDGDISFPVEHTTVYTEPPKPKKPRKKKVTKTADAGQDELGIPDDMIKSDNQPQMTTVIPINMSPLKMTGDQVVLNIEEEKALHKKTELERKKNKERLRERRRTGELKDLTEPDYKQSQKAIDTLIGSNGNGALPDVFIQDPKKSSKRRKPRTKREDSVLNGSGSQEENSSRVDTLEDARNRMHQLLDEAFSLVTPLQSSSDLGYRWKSRQKHRNKVHPTSGSSESSDEHPKPLPRKHAGKSMKKQDSDDSGVLPNDSDRSSRSSQKTSPVPPADEKKHTPIFVNPAFRPNDYSELTWTPYKAADQVATMISIPKSPDTEEDLKKKIEKEEKIQTTVFKETLPDSLRRDSIPSPTSAFTDSGTASQVYSKYLEFNGLGSSSSSQKRSPSSSALSDVEMADEESTLIQKAYQDKLKDKNQQERTGLSNSGFDEHMPPSKNIEEDEIDIISRSKKVGASPTPLIQSIRTELERISILSKDKKN